MNVVINVMAIGLSLFLLSIPLINHYVFHTVNIDEIIVAGRDGIKKVGQLQSDAKFKDAIDSSWALIGRFRNDSLAFYAPDVADWKLVSDIVLGKKPHRWAKFLIGDIDDDSLVVLRQSGETDLPPSMQAIIVKGLNYLAENDRLYAEVQDSISLEKLPDVKARLKGLEAQGVLVQQGGQLLPRENLTKEQRDRLRRVNVVLLEKALFPEVLRKDLNKGKDWASEFIVQTAMYNIGICYKALFQLDEAIKTWNDLINLYPKTIYAEVLFLQIGQALESDGRKATADGQVAAAEKRYQEAIKYLEKIERNREIAAEFPKYKYADLTPNEYVNVDQASKAKQRSHQKTAVYTTQKAKEELAGKKSDDRSGYNLEDAVRLIGECYTELGKTDSARAQYQLLLDFFPESDNLDDAQKLMAESYVKDGDMLLAKADSSDARLRAKAEDRYRLAVKEFLKFINVYPQSDLISETYIALGDVYNKLHMTKEATAAFASALGRAKEAEEQAKVQLKIGTYYYERRRFPEAVAAYQIILTNFLSTEVAPNAQYMLGQSYEGMGDTTKSIEAFQKILDHYKASSFLGNAAYKIGNHFFSKGEYREAATAYNVGFRNEPNGNLAAKTKFQLGMIWVKTAESKDSSERETAYKTAIDEFSELVKLFEGSEEADQAGYQMALCYNEIGREEKAREAVQKIQNRDIALKGMKIFGVGEGSFEKEVEYWDDAFRNAVENEERATALYEKALVQLDKLNKPDNAMQTFKDALALTTKNSKIINIQIGIARVYGAQKKFDEAKGVYRDLLANPRVAEELNQQLRINLYDTYFKAKQYDTAYDGFNKFSAELPAHNLAPLAYYRMGVILGLQGKFDDAMAKYQTILDKYPQAELYDDAVLGVGEQMANLGRHKDAVDYLRKFLKDHLDASVAANMWMKIGEIEAKNLDKKELALIAYDSVLTDTARQLYSYAAYQQGMLYKELGRDKDARAAFEKVKRADKQIYRAAQSEVGKIIAKTDPEGAIENYRRIVDGAESPEDSAIARIGIGDVYVSVKKFGEAAKTYSEVYETYGGKDTNLITGSLVKWADALMNGKQYNDAIKACRTMQQLYPNHPLTINTFYFEASAYMALEKYSQARTVFDTIIVLNRLAQLTEIAFYQRGDSYYFGKNPGEANRQYEQYIRKYPTGQFVPRAIYMQGNIAWAEKDFAAASRKFGEVVTKYPDFPEGCNAKNFWAYSLNKIDKWKDARKLFNEVLASGKCDVKTKGFAREQIEAINTQH